MAWQNAHRIAVETAPRTRNGLHLEDLAAAGIGGARPHGRHLRVDELAVGGNVPEAELDEDVVESQGAKVDLRTRVNRGANLEGCLRLAFDGFDANPWPP